MQDHALKRAGLKVTGPRIKILGVMESNSDRHLTAEEIFHFLEQQAHDVSLATVYRVLAQFESAGILKRHYFEGGLAVYELDEGEHHDHLVCVKCGAVQEFVDDVIEERQQYIADRYKFNMTDHSLTIYGVCQSCSKV